MPELLRDGVLDGLAVAAGGTLGERLTALGAVLVALETDPADEETALAAAASLERLDVVVADARGAFARGGYEGLRAAVDGAFLRARVATTERFVPAGRGRVVLVAPPPGAGPHASAAAAALENMARTLATEWARHGVTVVALRPGDATSEAELAELVAFLCSPAGAYYTGCALTLGAVAA